MVVCASNIFVNPEFCFIGYIVNGYRFDLDTSTPIKVFLVQATAKAFAESLSLNCRVAVMSVAGRFTLSLSCSLCWLIQ